MFVFIINSSKKINDKDNPKSHCHLLFLKIYFSYENCTFQTFKSNHYTTLRH
ncbi:hypothetical protein A608_0880 [Helicobacter pylori CCHI 33]|nr:hypothetical protein HPHPH36_0937 [Helicobacter pylori Hp H-36]EMR57335.1 hypothetical protein A608_0880 [Helicobacter pylori CCHI 33]